MDIIKFKLSNAILILGMIFLYFIFSSANASVKNVNFNDELTTIESYYWIGLEEKGNYKLFLKAKNKLEDLESKIKKIAPSNDILLKVKGLKEDIRQQLDMSSDTFFGIFPLSRFFNNNNDGLVFASPPLSSAMLVSAV